MFNQILCGNHLEILPRFPDDCFDMWLTSPPYDNLRTYEGYDFQFGPLARELYRVLKPGGVGVWIVNDATINGSETLTSAKQKIFFREVGFNIHDTMIYERSTVPLNHHRYEQIFEYMFVFVKGKLNTFHGLRTNTLHPGNKRKCKPGHRNQRGEFKMSYGRIVGNSKLLGNIWSYDVGYGRMGDLFASEHPAIFPEKLAEDHLLSWSNPGDVVLDPMCGSGTTCKMAAKHGRQYVGIDIAEKYCEIARKRVALIEAQPLLFNENAGEQSLARDPRKRGASSVI